ncbi:Bardet-Biedl syndrome 1 protein homolog [Coccinella septempunctata]|uniref:Bardet-Biedl syndrome 1 protein homolog n=1 Tax=Coccinella septempunctata TaxID=41139 RepID=UPI001D072905|nr:Bardet-Biedl syndrome 1 protein homolog [Coccinella septempunctata]
MCDAPKKVILLKLKMSRSELKISRWLDAHLDTSAGLNTLPRSAILSNVVGDGENRLVITDLRLKKDTKCRLKVYKGTVVTTDNVLPDVPSSIISFYHDRLNPRTPVVGVGCVNELLMFKNNKPFFKYSLPGLPVLPEEYDTWKSIDKNAAIDIQGIMDRLQTIPFQQLSSRSQVLLNLPPEKREEHILSYVNNEPMKINLITCMTTLKKTSQDPLSIACPVIATETGIVYILDPQNFSMLAQANVCNTKNTPFIATATGLYDVDYKIIIATRENQVCLLRRGWLEGKSIIHIDKTIMDMIFVPGDNVIVLATTDKMLHTYSRKGQKLWSIEMNVPITCLCLVALKYLNAHLVAVGQKGGLIQLYQGRRLVDFIVVPDSPSCMTFGQMGQEEHVMVIVTFDGAIVFKILKRTADFNLSHQDASMPILNQNKSLPLPKRSKLFLEQSMREREDPISMHRNFQQDLIRLRLTAAREMAQNLNYQIGSSNEKKQIKLSAQVLGLGPKFTVILSLENISTESPVVDKTVVFHVRPDKYQLSSYIFKIPLIPPNLSYKLKTTVQEVLSDVPEDTNMILCDPKQRILRIFVMKGEENVPVIAATINMPPTDLAY